MTNVTLTTDDALELRLLRDRLDRDRRDSHKKADWTTMRTNDLDREVEALDRLLRQVAK